MKCQTCRKEYSPDCDYRQGRCPHHPALLEQIVSWFKNRKKYASSKKHIG